MSRAKRHYLPGLIWHVTHRCHKREFLLKFNRDKRSWYRWLLEAKRAYGLCVLNYVVTSNHVHILILDRDDGDAARCHSIAKSLHLAEARVAQDYNKRKSRSGAFWEDRYHATAVGTGEHFISCLTYIDLNMVRARVVRHPCEWPFGGYYELQAPRQRYRNQLVDYRALLALLGLTSLQRLKEARARWVEERCSAGLPERDPKWTESVAVGSKEFVEGVMRRLGARGKGRAIHGEVEGETHILQEAGRAYLRTFEGGSDELRPKNGP